ncbi:hypothetical protein OD90_2085 [Dokdonia sp. Hel_I_53]|nr:hypothetical protein OD90_2085 [Dokdonia sp. Hel_I_53]
MRVMKLLIKITFAKITIHNDHWFYIYFFWGINHLNKKNIHFEEFIILLNRYSYVLLRIQKWDSDTNGLY